MKKCVVLVLILFIVSFYGYLIYQENSINNDINITVFEVPEKIYLAVLDEKEIEVNIQEKNNKKVGVSFISSDESVLTTKGNVIKGVSDGVVQVEVNTQNGVSKSIKVIVTSLISKLDLNNEKEYIKCGEYSKEESDLLEDILEFRINEAGYQTRGGTLAAARFLLLEFKSGIRYFNENGRLENHSSIKHIDGEGRFYHKGLYLTQDKFSEIVSSSSDGPKVWGCELKNLYYNKNMENGLNCSGFITWALFNAGFDIKDVGAGDYSYINN